MYKKLHIKNNEIKQNLRKPSLAISFKLPKVYFEKSHIHTLQYQPHDSRHLVCDFYF